MFMKVENDYEITRLCVFFVMMKMGWGVRYVFYLSALEQMPCQSQKPTLSLSLLFHTC